GEGLAADARLFLDGAAAAALEAAGGDEGEDAGELAEVEPGAVLLADVDDHPAHLAEVLPVHQGSAHRAGDVAVARVGAAGEARGALGEGSALVVLEQLPEQGVLDELAAAARAVEEGAALPSLAGAGIGGEDLLAHRARQGGRLADGLEPQRVAT